MPSQQQTSNTPPAKRDSWIPGFEGIYKITEDGDIFSFYSRGQRRSQITSLGKRIVGGIDKDGYRKVILRKDGKRFYKRVHALVAMTFLGEQPKNTVVCHNDGNLKNNNYKNLRYASQRENIADKKEHGTHICGERSCKSILTKKQVMEIYQSAKPSRNLAVIYGVSRGSISGIKSGYTWAWLTGHKRAV